MRDNDNTPKYVETFELTRESMGIPQSNNSDQQNAPLISMAGNTSPNHDSLKTYRATDYVGFNKTGSDTDGSSIVLYEPTNRRKQSFVNQKEASIPSSIFNLCNTIIGAGILGLPDAVAQTGYVIAALLFLGIAFTNVFTLNLNMTCARRLSPHSSYTTLCNATVPKLQLVVDLSVAITCFGVCCAYFVVIGDLLPDVVDQILEENDIGKNANDFVKLLRTRVFWAVTYLLLFILPTIRLRKMDSLRFTSFFALICFTYITIIVVLYAMVDSLDPCDRDDHDDSCDGGVDVFPTGNYGILKIFKAAPIYMFAYTCHFNTFSICNELKDNSMARINKVIICTMSMCCVIYCIVGYFGYFTYGSNADSNILTKYPKHNSILIVRIGLSFAIAFSYPVLLHPCRNCLGSIFLKQPDCSKLSWIHFWILTALIVVFSFGVSLVAENLGDILGIVGSSGISVIAFVLPGLFYYYMDEVNEKTEKHYEIKKNCGLFFVVVGLILIPFCIVMQFLDVDSL